MKDESILLSDRVTKSVLEQFEDPIKMMILIKVLREPDITSNKLKKQIIIPGTKIYYYLNQLTKHDPPLIIESGSEKVSEHLIRRKFRISEELEYILNNTFAYESTSDAYRLYILYLSIAMQTQQLRITKKLIKDGRSDEIPDSLVMFVDDQIAKELDDGIRKVFNKCYNKYKGVDRSKSIRLCNFGAIAGIYPMNF